MKNEARQLYLMDPDVEITQRNPDTGKPTQLSVDGRLIGIAYLRNGQGLEL